MLPQSSLLRWVVPSLLVAATAASAQEPVPNTPPAKAPDEVPGSATIDTPAPATTPPPANETLPATTEKTQALEPEPGQTKVENQFKKDHERVIVTGSRIRRIDVENAVPTKVLKHEDFEKAGITSMTDLLQTQTENTFGSFNGGAGYVNVGRATVSLHGLGAGRTLILINGRRLPNEASLGGTNINNIPLAMVERVEVLKTAESAIYGSDAVAGVINVILKKSFTGTEVETKAALSNHKGGNSVQASATTGFNVWDTDVTLAVGGGKEDSILTRNRPQLWRAEYPYNLGAGGAPDGTYQWGLLNTARPTQSTGAYNFHASPNCPTENQITYPNDPGNVYCVGDGRSKSLGELRPQVVHRYGTLNFEHAFGEVSSSLTVLASQTDTRSVDTSRTLTSNPARSGNYALPFSQTPGDLQAAITAAGIDTTNDPMIKISAPQYFPRYTGHTETRDNMIGGMFSLSGPLSGEWKWNFDASHFATKRLRTYLKASDKLQFIDNLFPISTTATPNFNIFTDDLSEIGGYFADLHTEEANLISGATAYATGPVFKLSGGDASVAAGVSAYHEKYILRADPKDKQFLNQFPETAGIYKARYLGSYASDGYGKRDTTSAFAELDLPFYKSLDAGIAGRFDHYSDFGDTFNFGANVVESPIDQIKLRGSVGSGFRAPTLAEVFNRNSGGYLTVTDPVYCNNTVPADNPCGNNGKVYSTYVNSPGNPDLKEETSLSYALGFVLEPHPFYTVSFDYWATSIKDIIGQESLDELIKKEIAGQSLGSSTINRGDDGKIGSIDNSYANLGTLKSKGYDIASKLNITTGPVNYGLDSSYSRVLSQKGKPTKTDPEREYVGAFGVPRYRLSNSLFMNTDKHRFSFDTLTIGRQESGYFDTDPTFGYISPETVYSVSYAYNYMKTGTLTLGVYNIEDRITSLYVADKETRDVGYLGSTTDVRGRQFQIGIRQAF